MVKIYLLEDWGDFEEGKSFKVYEEELWSADDISMRKRNGFVEVETEYGEVVYITEDLMRELHERLS